MNIFYRLLSFFGFVVAFLFIIGVSVFAQDNSQNSNGAKSLLNVSYDLSRELYKEINPAFISYWKNKNSEDVVINQSHGGSSKQALSVLGGLEADIVTMNQASDIDALATKGGLVAKNWRDLFAYDSSPYSTTTVFIVRKGNPKNIKDWADLLQNNVEIIVPNPKTSGNGRYTYLSAWGYAFKKFGSDEKAKEFVKSLFEHVPVLDGGGRGATTTFAQREMGDVLITFENEVAGLKKEFGEDKFEVIYPSISVEASAPVAIVESVATKHSSKKLAISYINFLFSNQGQEIIANHFFRPRNPEIFAKYRDRFPAINSFKIEEIFGSWDKIQAMHFADDAIYDQIILRK